MSYADMVKQGVLDSDTPPGFSAKPSPVKRPTKQSKQTQSKKKVEEPVLDVEGVEAGVWHDPDDSSATEEFDAFAEAEDEFDQEPTPSGKRYVRKGTVPAPTTSATTTPNKGKSDDSFEKRQLKLEFQNIKELVLSTYSDRLAVLNGIAKEMNDELKSEIKTKEREWNNKIKKINQPPKAQKSVWKGGERNQDAPVEPGKKKFNENNKDNSNAKKGGKNNNNNNQKAKGGNKKKDTDKKGSSKIHVTTVDEDGFVLKQVLTGQQAELAKKGIAVPVEEEITPEVVEEKKKPTINSNSYYQNNPFGAVLLAGSYESAETELAKKQQKKAQASKSNKVKQRKAGQQQQQEIQKLAEQTSKSNTQNKKKKNTAKQPAQTQKKPAQAQTAKTQPKKSVPTKQQQEQDKKKQQKKAQEKNAQNEAKAKKDLQIKKQKDAETLRLQNEEKRISANLRDVEKEKKLLRLAKKNQSKNQEWYENEYVQPAALVGACIIVLGVVYSFVFQV